MGSGEASRRLSFRLPATNFAEQLVLGAARCAPTDARRRRSPPAELARSETEVPPEREREIFELGGLPGPRLAVFEQVERVARRLVVNDHRDGDLVARDFVDGGFVLLARSQALDRKTQPRGVRTSLRRAMPCR